MVSSVSSALLWWDLLAIGIGIVSVAWPGITVGAFVILFADMARGKTALTREACFLFTKGSTDRLRCH
jgi:hypothetical protein